ncbi:glycosyltransferase family 4 protein [Rickettsia endosymbiont of Oedothorax gibbosus]|uniref:glycosyltransferase family 4 protein n=1 Tax=Rickettsia endosymbiont of Oedothorax gibbosus TaxID=931099 RepID=UPI0020249DC9|nr:glycosyltransferase family 4 protein [Rickettsia endosymbiont of Oedothorax gibbosus]
MISSDSPKRYHKPTILQVVPALFSGGVERGTIEVAKMLKKVDYNVIVVSSGGSLVEELIAADIPHISMNSATKNPFSIWRHARILSEIIKEYDVDIVHARSRAPAWSCYMAAKATNTKFLTTFHGIYNISNLFKHFYNSVMIKGEKVIAVSNFVKQHIVTNYKILEEQIVVIRRGVDYRYFDPQNVTEEKLVKYKKKYGLSNNTPPIILLPSRITSWKGHLALVEALGKLKHLDFYCLMVGDLSKHPNFTNRIKSLINLLKLQSKVQIFGNEIDMLGLYGISDIVLSTSIEPEAFGRTITEGQSMEKLVIATNIGGAIETISDTKTGFHVKPNDPSDLAEKIEHCLSILKTNEGKKIQQAARKAVIDNFSLDLMLSKTLDLYKEMLKKT